MIYRITMILVSFLILVISNQVAFADTNASTEIQTFDVGENLQLSNQRSGLAERANETGASIPVQFILDLIDILALIIGSFSMLVIVVSGIMMITAAGNSETIDKAKSGLLYAIIGLVITFSSYIVTTFVQSLFF